MYVIYPRVNITGENYNRSLKQEMKEKLVLRTIILNLLLK